ncbi:hypothetical protein M569_10745 [Genlisea aurea]|uniref:Pectinesterase inhibitor domain-containing protein n=1 Tax=Genlisea aurea TaxID=192259 RepID=S8CAU2_9LAMI|nr:hypothetical protein M569_10745 [Genlisea aurea]
MASPHNAFLSTVAIIIFTFAAAAVVVSPSESSDVEEICSATDYPALCLSSAAPYLNGRRADLASVLEASAKFGEELAESALTQLRGLAQRPELGSVVVAECEGSYETALLNFRKAIGSDGGAAIGGMSAVMGDLSDCEEALGMLGEDEEFLELAAAAEKVTNVTSNCMGMMAQLGL